MKTINLTQGYVALVDDADYERANALKWYAQKTKQYIYAARRDYHRGPITYLHKFVLGLPKKVFVDHKDHDTLNCQRDNLRPCNNRQNQWNGVIPKKRSTHPSKYKGVSFEYGKWRARIRVGGKKTNLGSFTNEWEAAQAYNKKALDIHGEFANINVCMNPIVLI